MIQKITITVLLTLSLLKFSSAQEQVVKAAPGIKYTIENCINPFNMDKAVKTSVGYQYWFIPQNFLEDGLTVKMSVVGPKQATHAPHKHAGDETFFILEGTAQFYLDGKPRQAALTPAFIVPKTVNTESVMREIKN